MYKSFSILKIYDQYVIKYNILVGIPLGMLVSVAILRGVPIHFFEAFRQPIFSV